ncbi:MAG: TorD/DmsD family molecular chaperone [Chloroflexota bacterium]
MFTVLRLAEEDLVAYGLCCKFLGEAFYRLPQPPLWQTILDEHLFETWPLSTDDPFTRTGLTLLTALTAQARNDDATFDVLEDDYAALFVGPARLKAPPWESVYRSRDHIMFEKQTREVRAFYASYGLQFNRINKEPDDHFGLELLFLAYLLGQALERREAGDTASQTQIIGDVGQFLQAHTLHWAEAFLGRVINHAMTDYYRGIAYLAAGMLLTLCTKLAIPWELEL